MKKIPTIYVRDFGPESLGHYVNDLPNPECEWVFAGEGMPTRKYNGVCTMFDGDVWWMRREVKSTQTPPEDFVQVAFDTMTDKMFGWVPANTSAHRKFMEEALRDEFGILDDYQWRDTPRPGTFELVGPRINGNPEGVDRHVLIRHGYVAAVERRMMDSELKVDPFAFGEWWEIVQQFFVTNARWEGIVWHHPDGRMAKIKARDFRK